MLHIKLNITYASSNMFRFLDFYILFLCMFKACERTTFTLRLFQKILCDKSSNILYLRSILKFIISFNIYDLTWIFNSSWVWGRSWSSFSRLQHGSSGRLNDWREITGPVWWRAGLVAPSSVLWSVWQQDESPRYKSY